MKIPLPSIAEMLVSFIAMLLPSFQSGCNLGVLRSIKMPDTSKPEPVPPHDLGSSKAELTNDPRPPFKRPAVEDEIEFISCNPVKKRLAEQTTVHSTTISSEHPQPQDTRSTNQKTKDFPHTSPTGRCQSLCGIGQTRAPGPGTTMESRGTSLPVLEKFTFPQTFPPMTGRSPRGSDAISPKQLPQSVPEPLKPGANWSRAGTNTATTVSAAKTGVPAPVQANSVTLDQISCLNVNGIPTHSPEFDAGRVFPADGGIMSGISVSHTTSSVPPRPAFPTSSSRNGTLFSMYSADSILTAPQAHHGEKLSVPVLLMETKQTSCTHCALIRQQNAFRQVPVSGPSHQIATQTQGHINFQSHDRTSTLRNMLSHPVFSAPGHIPRSTPTPIQEKGQLQSQCQHRCQQPPPQSLLHQVSVTSSHYLQPLLQDMAQTIQASFPYAQVAARHGITPAKVAEVLASVVGAPLVSKRE